MMSDDSIRIHGAAQNNLKDLDLEIPLGELVVVTGVSGSGKSSLAFDTVYSEGQRRYVETFSPYARQFLDRMDKPRAKRIDGIPPAIAIDQTNPVRTSRSTVGTMTEINDHLKLLFARAAVLRCRGCGEVVERNSPQSIAKRLLGPATGVDGVGGVREAAPDRPLRSAPPRIALGDRLAITFRISVPANFAADEVTALLERQGYLRHERIDDATIEVVQDRLRLSEANRGRLIESLESAFKHGNGQLAVRALNCAAAPAQTRLFSAGLHCAHCDIHYRDPIPSLFSFNSPIGACDSCRGFGRTMGIDYGLVIPDVSLSLANGAVKPWQTEAYKGWQRDFRRHAKAHKIPTHKPWCELTQAQRAWVLNGEGAVRSGKWYGVRGFFDWLETKSYRMHIRVLLSRYRSYDQCSTCGGARLKNESLLWRVGGEAESVDAVAPDQRFAPLGLTLSADQFRSLPGLTLHDIAALPLDRCRDFFAKVRLPTPLDDALAVLLDGVRSRLRYLVGVGLGYLTLDRQSRTLSGGEVQRINLTTALGTSLVNTLFVLDEPSIGLHARDMSRVVNVLHDLRNAGNSLLVVEHDAQVMLAADRIIDMGPGPGEHGGEVVFNGTPQELLRSRQSKTANYLSGRQKVGEAAGITARPVNSSLAHLRIRGAAAHNLKSVNVDIPLGRLVCITGVSGSGKSTLVEDVCYRALAKLMGKSVETPGPFQSIEGHEHLGDVVMVDQTPIGRTTRSNPASYVGALDAIRKLFAAEPLALERSYTAGTFSFNSGNGRCPTCGGNGFEHVEMQFLSDVYLRCPDCDGRRYRPEILEVRLLPASHLNGPAVKALSIAEVLELTVNEAAAFFSSHADVQKALQSLKRVGLGYLKLGQPVPTLSGGESQRLKLAGRLAKARPHAALPNKRASKKTNSKVAKTPRAAPSLFIFDEPTTGLHFEDVAVLMGAFDELVADGHSVVVIEHHLDVIAAADWVIDLGPEGGSGGGQLVCAGTPTEIAAFSGSHTGAALANMDAAPVLSLPAQVRGARARKRAAPSIEVRNAREHNLRNVDISIPRDKLTVVSGVSGSGKSTLAFDILFNEGQRRYLESLNAYARQFVQPAARPEVDAIFGIPPTVAIEQRTSRGGRKSTVATMTEVYHFLRLLFVKLGIAHCPDCELPIQPQTEDALAAQIMRQYRGRSIHLLSPLIVSRKGYYTDLAHWALRKGYAQLRVDGDLLATDNWPRLDRFREHDIDLPVAKLNVDPRREAQLRAALSNALALGKGAVKIAPSGRGSERLFSTRRSCPGCARSFAELDPRQFSYNSKLGWCVACFGTGQRIAGFDAEQTGEESAWHEDDPVGDGHSPDCKRCGGQRLRPEALAVQFAGQNIATLASMAVTDAQAYFSKLRLSRRDGQIARDVVAELSARLAFMEQVGLGYLSLDRAAPTLSGGEAQRVRLAAQLGSNLKGVCYILDEPTIGLHTRDNQMLLATLRRLQQKGNTVVVVEHDEKTIRQADHLIDLGPGAGVNGGQVVAKGSVKAVQRSKTSLTGRLLKHPLRHPLLEHRRPPISATNIKVQGASLHNLQNISTELPLGRLVCVTGVSGSGKSTLIRQVVAANLSRLLGAKRAAARIGLSGCKKIEGWKSITRVLEVDQTPIGKTPRSCPATYVGIWDHVRRIFAETSEARLRGHGPSRFSFNVRGGRCEACDGQGMQRIEMNFLPDVRVPCDSCAGQRFATDTLEITYRDRNIADVLAMSIDEATDFFKAHTKVHQTLALLQEIGLGYLSLGQPSPSLSGGESQRLKLVTELSKAPRPEDLPIARPARKMASQRATPHTLYILDEPTIGLHMADVEKLARVLHRLVDAGNSVFVIEHNLDVIAEADWILDLGPEGGTGGGKIAISGTPEALAKRPRASHTAHALAEFLGSRAALNSG